MLEGFWTRPLASDLMEAEIAGARADHSGT